MKPDPQPRPHTENDLDFGPTLRGLRAGMKVFAQRYTLKHQLGRGGMGVVWLAQDSRLDREVALKFLPEAVQGDLVAVDELKRETRRCLQLTHPNIVRIFDFEQEDNSAAIAMEYIQGQTLSELRMQRPERVFEASEILPWLETAVATLHYAHTEAKLVHRDLKPANFMVDHVGHLKLADFGIACRITETFSRVSRGVNAAGAGTLVYMSPQQLMGFPPSVADDVYSFGATLYELFTGKPPFHRGSIERQIEAVVPPSMTERRVELEVASSTLIPASWEQAVAACLHKDAAARPQSMQAALQCVLGISPAVEKAPVAPPPQLRKVPTPPASAPVARVVKERRGMPQWLRIAAILVCAGLAWAGYHFGYALQREKELQQQGTVEQLAAQTAVERLQKEKEDAERLVREKDAELKRQQLAGKDVRDKQMALQAELDRKQREEAEAQRQKMALEAVSKPKVLKVPTDHATIQGALDAAKDGDTVMVSDGIYRESLEFKSGVRLLGVNAGSCRIQPPPGAMCAIFALNCTSGSIENVTVEGGGTLTQKIILWGWKAATDPNDKRIASIEAQGIAKQAGLRPGDSLPIKVNEHPINALSYLASLRGRLASSLQLELADGRKLEFAPELVDGTKENMFPDGLVLIHSHLSVRKCVIERLGGTGIIAENHSILEAEGNTISDNLQSGILFDESSGRLVDNIITGNKWYGVNMENDSASEILRNRINQNARYGLSVWHCNIPFLIAENTFDGNQGSGINVEKSEAVLTIRDNECRGNKSSGIWLGPGSRGTVTTNICSGNHTGITNDGGGATLLDNTCSENTIGGIYVHDGATGTIKGNTCDRNSSGIFIRGKSTKVEIVNNRADNNSRHGYVVETVSVPVRFENNIGSGNKEGLSLRTATWSKK